MKGCAGGLSLCSILQKYFPFLLPPISKQNQPHDGGAVVWHLCPPSWAAQTLTQSRRWTAARFPGLSMPLDGISIWPRWANASSCAGLAAVHKWQARFFIFPWTVIASSPLHLQTCGCTSTSEWAYLLYIWMMWELQALEQGPFVSRHCTQPCREPHGGTSLIISYEMVK